MIYADAAATLPLLPQLHEYLVDMLKEDFGNPHAQHDLGCNAKKVIERSSLILGQAIKCGTNEIVWTSGATEANNLAIFNALHWASAQGLNPVIAYHPLGHKSLIEPPMKMASGWTLLPLPIDKAQKRFIPDVELKKWLDLHKPSVILSAYGNNEIGVIDSLEVLHEYAQNEQVWLHLDAAQSLCKIPIDLRTVYCHSMSFSGHKIGALTGIGALYTRLRPKRGFYPMFFGGGQQLSKRPGTMPTLLVGIMAQAVELWHVNSYAQRLYKLREKCVQVLKQKTAVTLLSDGFCLPHIVTFMAPEDKAGQLALFMQEVACSQGSACSVGIGQGSSILSALDLSLAQQARVCRVSLSPIMSDKDQEDLLRLIQYYFGDKTNE